MQSFLNRDWEKSAELEKSENGFCIVEFRFSSIPDLKRGSNFSNYFLALVEKGKLCFLRQ